MVPEKYRTTKRHRALWAVMSWLADTDTAGPLVRKSGRTVLKRAADRRHQVAEARALDLWRAYFRHEREQVLEAIKNSGGQQTTGKDAVTRVLGDMRPDLEATWREAARATALAAAKRFPRSKAEDDDSVESHVERWLARESGEKITAISEATRRAVRAELAAGYAESETLPQLAARVESLYLDEIIPNRAQVIARTETTGAQNWGQLLGASLTSVPMEKEWFALDDDRTRDDHAEADGQRVALDVPFDVGGEPLMYPGDPIGSAENVINCRCSVLYHVVEEKSVTKYDEDEPRDDNGRWSGGSNPHAALWSAIKPGDKVHFHDGKRVRVGHVAQVVGGSLTEPEKASVTVGTRGMTGAQYIQVPLTGILRHNDKTVLYHVAEAKSVEKIGWTDEAREAALAARRANAVAAGMKAAGLPEHVALPTGSTLHDLFSSDHWDLKATEMTGRYMGPQEAYEVAINPKVPAAGIVSDETRPGHTNYFDEALSRPMATENEYQDRREFNPDNRAGYVHDLPFQREEGMIYRGMSYEEFHEAQKTGVFRSQGSYNLGPEQENLTYFSHDPEQAAHYGGGFAPYQFQPTFERPGYVIKIQHPGADREKKVQGVGEDEVGLTGEVKTSDVRGVVEMRPWRMSSGEVELRRTYNRTPDGRTVYSEGSRMSPSGSYAYKLTAKS